VEPVWLPLAPAPNMIRADLYYVKPAGNPKAALVLAPGCNGDGKTLVYDPVWQKFAQEHDLCLVGLSFASNSSDLRDGRGYYYAAQGSGKLLLDGIRRILGQDVPLLLYGFSGGAHFTARFVEWQPQRVVSWCAYSAGWWDKPSPSKTTPPGIVACGVEDERLGASLTYFKQGRALSRPWLWIAVAENKHSPNKDVEMFVRDYFGAILEIRKKTLSTRPGMWVDIDKLSEADEEAVRQYPTIAAWLPTDNLFDRWRLLMEHRNE